MPDLPQNDRAEMEAKVTALLLGELPASEAETVRKAMQQDAALRAWHDRLQSTLGFVRESVVAPEDQPGAQPAPLQLSDARRERLLAHFKTVKPKEFQRPKTNYARWVFWAASVAAVVVLAAMIVPSFSRARNTSAQNATINNLRLIDAAKQQWALENAKPSTAVPTEQDLAPYFGRGESVGFPQEKDVAFEIGPVGQMPVARTKNGVIALNGVSPQAGDVTGRSLAYQVPPPEQPAPATAPPQAWSVSASSTPYYPANTKTLNDPRKVIGITNANASDLTEALKSFDQARIAVTSEVVTTSPLQSRSDVPGLQQEITAAPSFGVNSHIGLQGGTAPPPVPSVLPAAPPESGAVAAKDSGKQNDQKSEAYALNAVGYINVNAPPTRTNEVTPARSSFQDNLGVVQNASSAGQLAENSQIQTGPSTEIAGVGGAPTIITPSAQAASPPSGLFAGSNGGGGGGGGGFAGEGRQKLSSVRGSYDDNYLASGAHFASAAKGVTTVGVGGLPTTTPAQAPATSANVPVAAPSAVSGSEPERANTLKKTPQVSSNNPFVGRYAYSGEAINIEKLPLGNQTILTGKTIDDAPAQYKKKPAPIPQSEVLARDNPFSTFSLNVSDASFRLAAASLAQGQMPDPASIRSEDFINAFDYRDPEPGPGAPLAFASERATYPYEHNRDLLRFSIKTASEGRADDRPLNLVILLDKSGSMERADRVEITRQALKTLSAQLREQDIVSVVVFAQTARLWADGVSGTNVATLAQKLGDIAPEGGTDLEQAMRLAYAIALRHYVANGENRVVLLTDGAANLGNVDPEILKQQVASNRRQGISFDCFGIGWEGYNDDMLETLSRTGGGRYGFINTPEEAGTEFAGNLAGALRVAAYDVKTQVEFNPNRVTAYRQIGYAKDQLTKEQFRDNSVKAAQIGAAESGNALYVAQINPGGDGPIATVRVRFRLPGSDEYQEREWTVPYQGSATPLESASATMRLAATACAFSEWLGGNPYAGEVTTDQLLSSMASVSDSFGADPRPKLLESMIRQAKSISGR